jgi:hypothetical protein
MALYTNNTKHFQYPNGVAVAPGVTMDIPGWQESEKKQTKKKPKATSNTIDLSLSTNKIKPLIEASDDIDQLNVALDSEEKNQNRKGVITAINERILTLSSETSTNDKE